MPEFRSNINMGGVAKITSLVDPTAAQDGATKAYVDSTVEGLNWKDSVRVASIGANINLAAPGASIDGISMAANDRFLAKDQTTTADNGIYIWNSAAGAATRAPDMSTAAEVEAAVVSVEEGTNAGATFRQTAVNVTLGTTALAFVTFGTSAPAASETTSGIAELATQAETNTGTDDLRIVTPLKLATWSLRAREKVGNIGDGAATAYNITHSWGTRNVSVTVFRNATPWDTIICDVTRPDTNTVTLTFASAPTTNQFSYVLHTGGTA